MYSGDVLFDDAEIKSVNWLIDNSVNELIELTSAFGISGLIAVGIDAIMVSILEKKTRWSRLQAGFYFHISGAVLHIDQEAILKWQTFYSYNFP